MEFEVQVLGYPDNVHKSLGMISLFYFFILFILKFLNVPTLCGCTVPHQFYLSSTEGNKD